MCEKVYDHTLFKFAVFVHNPTVSSCQVLPVYRRKQFLETYRFGLDANPELWKRIFSLFFFSGGKFFFISYNILQINSGWFYPMEVSESTYITIETKIYLSSVSFVQCASEEQSLAFKSGHCTVTYYTHINISFQNCHPKKRNPSSSQTLVLNIWKSFPPWSKAVFESLVRLT